MGEPRSDPAEPGTVVSRSNPIVLALLGVACISTSAILVRLADAAPGTTAFYRCALALPVLVPLAMLERRRFGARSGARRLQAGLAGALLGIDLVLWTHSIYDIGAGIATVLGNLQVLFVAFIAWRVFHERPGSTFLVALPAVLTGVVFVAGLASRTPLGDHPVVGVLYGLVSSLAYGAFIMILRASVHDAREIAGPLADATLGATLASLIIGLATHEIAFSLPLHALLWLLLLAMTSQTLGWLFLTSSLPHLPAALASLLLLLQPAASLVIAAVVLSERPTLLQLLGALLVCAGIVYAARPSKAHSAITLPEPAG